MKEHICSSLASSQEPDTLRSQDHWSISFPMMEPAQTEWELQSHIHSQTHRKEPSVDIANDSADGRRDAPRLRSAKKGVSHSHLRTVSGARAGSSEFSSSVSESALLRSEYPQFCNPIHEMDATLPCSRLFRIRFAESSRLVLCLIAAFRTWRVEIEPRIPISISLGEVTAICKHCILIMQLVCQWMQITENAQERTQAKPQVEMR